MYDRPDYPGGPIINYLRLLPKLVESGCKVDLLSIYHGDYPNAREIGKKGIVVHPHPYTYTLSLVKWILEKAEAIQPDIFIPDVSTPGCFAGKWLKLSGVPVINVHRSDDEINWGRAIYFSAPEFNHVLTGIVCVNSYLESKLREKIAKSPILTTVIPSGVPIPGITANQEQTGLKIVYAGRLVQKQKRVKEILEAFIKLCDRYHNIEFTIIGDGPEKQNSITFVKNTPFASRFIFKGNLLGDDYKEELARHHVIVLLSDYEGTPGSFMDGMSCGLIPVCLHFDGVEDLVKHNVNGLIVEDRGNSFQDAIDRLYRNPLERVTLSGNARQHIEDHYSIEMTTKKWIAFFEQCSLMEKKKVHFVQPAEIILPEYNPLLPEYFIYKVPSNIFHRGWNKIKNLLRLIHSR